MSTKGVLTIRLDMDLLRQLKRTSNAGEEDGHSGRRTGLGELSQGSAGEIN